MKRSLPLIIIAAVACTALAAGAVLYRAKLAELVPTADANNPGAKPGAKPPHIHGNAKAQITIEEFADFQCPPCATVSRWLPQLERSYGGKLRIVFRNFPLSIHQNAVAAACAAEAAGVQGRFWEMHDSLYRQRDAWAKAADPRPAFETYAGEIGLDVARFKADTQSDAVKNRVQADQQRGVSLNVTSTPTLIVNNFVVPGTSANEKSLRVMIDDFLAGKTPTATPKAVQPAAVASPSPIPQ